MSAENLAKAKDLQAQLAASENKELEMIMLKGIHCADYTMTTTHGKYFARYTSDYGEEYELTYSLSDDAILLIEFDGDNSIDYTVSFDGSDTMYLIDVDGNEIEFERI